MKAVNLIPNDQRRGGMSVGVGAGRSEGAAYVVLALLVCVALLAFLYGHAKHQASGRKSEAAALKTKATTLQSQVTSLSPYTSFVKLREEREQAVASLVDSRFDWAHVFHEFGRVLPRNVTITSLDGTVGSTAATATTTSGSTASTSSSSSSSSSTAAPSTSAPSTTAAGASATSATPPGSVPSFTLAGCATSQRAVALMLQRLRLIDGVSDVTLQSSTKGASGGASASGSGGNCTASDAVFTATVAFEALPATSEAAAAAKGKSSNTTVSSSGGATASTPASGGAQ